MKPRRPGTGPVAEPQTSPEAGETGAQRAAGVLRVLRILRVNRPDRVPGAGELEPVLHYLAVYSDLEPVALVEREVECVDTAELEKSRTRPARATGSVCVRREA